MASRHNPDRNTDSRTPTLRPYQLESFTARFWARVDRSAGAEACWPWTGCRDRDGYGKGIYLARKRPSAHRVAFLLTFGLWPDPCGLHTCDNPPCCNPAHIIPGSNEENTADRHAKRRDARGDRNGTRRRPDRLARGTRNGKHTHPEKVQRGEKHPAAKITAESAREIRAARATGEGPTSISRRLGVPFHTVYDICRGKTWRHV